MDLKTLAKLAEFLQEEPQYVAYLSADTQLNTRARKSQGFGSPDEAFEEAKKFAVEARHTGISYGVKAEIGDDVVVTEISGYVGTT